MSIREKEAELWCPICRTLYGQVFRVQKNEVVWTHETEPAEIPARCTRCETVIERRRA